MALLKINDLTKDYGSTRIFENIKAQINSGDKIGLVGKNGAGKTTLIKVLTSELLPDQGEVISQKDITIGYLSQAPNFDINKTLYQEMKQVFDNIFKIEKEMQRLEELMGTASEKELEGIMNKYSNLRETFEASNGYAIHRHIRSVLKGLGFNDSDFNRYIRNFSGGEKTRAFLGQKLLEKPDLLILDEPTNYLDLNGISWLEDYLENTDITFVIITHDRYFLDKTVNIIWELEDYNLTEYKGNYSKYVADKSAYNEKLMKEYKHQQKKIEKTKEFIERNIAGQKTKQAQSRRKQLERMEPFKKPKNEKSLSLKLDSDRRSGEEVLSLSDISKEIEGNHLFSSFSLKVFRGEKIGIMGPNGSGKSTLLKIIANIIAPSTGTVRYGSNIKIGYLDQEQKSLSYNYTLIEEIRKELPWAKEEEIRKILGKFLFPSEQMDKLVSTLSGGEMVRLTLAKLFIKKANVLLLDEPTNHLDISGREALESALKNFDGTLLVVSHDRYLLDNIISKLINVSNEKVEIFTGNYSEFVEKLAKVKQDEKESKQKYSHKKQIKKDDKNINTYKKTEEVMEEIDQLEKEKTQLESLLGDPELYKDEMKARETNINYQKLTTRLDDLYLQLDELEI
ncbi:ABC-F family ATP-binding cassette domain-containing protein [Natranaerobius trueperi]|uniref:ABC transporter domain-containing protein n=1 Tax=Natranaerobius trueperi TaxID=759412 RepID=A0A226C0K9_9FIRM|nr:ABC-F family ATP-binding cassette domain-containing protein [Natranaerobius trueperi]OWZ84793.1 hypothetical protein CDO51_01895 [Natranaerobius trueperi]